MRRLLSLVLLFWLCAPLALASGGGKKEPPKGPSYFELKPALVMNIAEGGKFVRCDVQLLINDPPPWNSLRMTNWWKSPPPRSGCASAI